MEDFDSSETALKIDQKPNTDDIIFPVKDYLDHILNDFSGRFKNNKGKEYSLIDVLNFRGADLPKLKRFFEILNIYPDTQEGIQELNRIYQCSVNIFKERYGKKLPLSVENKKFHSLMEVKKILDNTGKSFNGVFYCAISKVFLLLSLISKDKRIIYIDKIHDNITKSISQALFSELHEKRKGYKIGEVGVNGKSVETVFIHRPKSIDSIMGKMMGNIDYNGIDDFSDLHGYTIEMDTENKSDIILTMQNLYFNVLKHKVNKENIKIDNKSLITELNIEETEGLDNDFKEFLYDQISNNSGFIEKKKKDKKTNHKYSEIKFKVDFETENPVVGLADLSSGTEIKFTIKGNENENGLSFQPIYDQNKKFRELTRAVGYIRIQDIIQIVNTFFEKLDDELQKKGKNRDIYLQELIDDLSLKGYMKYQDYKADDEDILKNIELGLFRYYEKGLLKVKGKKNSKHFFYVDKSYKELEGDVVPNVYDY